MSLRMGMKGGEYISFASACVSSSAGQGSSSSLCCTSRAQAIASIGSWKAIVKASPSVRTCTQAQQMSLHEHVGDVLCVQGPSYRIYWVMKGHCEGIALCQDLHTHTADIFMNMCILCSTSSAWAITCMGGMEGYCAGISLCQDLQTHTSEVCTHAQQNCAHMHIRGLHTHTSEVCKPNGS